MKRILLAIVCALVFAAPANAHLVAKPKNNTLKAVLASQTENLKHATYVCNHGAGAHKAWSCKAVTWLTVERGETLERLYPPIPTDPVAAIRYVFGAVGQADEAVNVARCETGGTFSVYAQNGQYLGLFQMGAYARSRYGHSYTAYGQARAALAYWRAAGWSPWQCLPGGGLRW